MAYKKVYKARNGFYLLKKHFCPDCQTRLKRITASKTLNMYSPEAWDMRIKDKIDLQFGAVEYLRTDFKCPNCGKQITVEEMKAYENVDPKKEKNIKFLIGTILVILYVILQIVIRK